MKIVSRGPNGYTFCVYNIPPFRLWCDNYMNIREPVLYNILNYPHCQVLMGRPGVPKHHLAVQTRSNSFSPAAARP